MSDYPINLWQRAHPARWRVGPQDRKVSLLVVHATSGHADARATAARWSREPEPYEPRTSAHFVIGNTTATDDGYVIQCVHLDNIASHAHAASAVSVGIELCAREPGELGHDDPGLPPSAAQLEACARLIAYLCRKLSIPCDREHVKGHAEADSETGHTGCPAAAGVDVAGLVTAARALRQPELAVDAGQDRSRLDE